MILRSRIDPNRVRAFVAQMQLWLIELAAWLAGFLGDGAQARALRAEVREDLFDMRRDLARAVFLLALPQIVLRRGPWRGDHPANTPPGCLRREPTFSMRLAARRIRLRGGLAQRAATLSRLIRTLDTHVARMARAMSRACPEGAPVLVHDAGAAPAPQWRTERPAPVSS